MTTHKCSYYCNPPVHGIETVSLWDVESVTQHYKGAYGRVHGVVRLIMVREVTEPSKDFIEAPFKNNGVSIDMTYKPYLVVAELDEKTNLLMLKGQHCAAS